MTPNIQLNFMAIGISVLASFILGFLWYTPLFGKLWAKELGLNFDQKPPTSAFVRGMLMNVIGNFLMAWVFAHNIAVWNPATWGLEQGDMTPSNMAWAAAFFTYLGFYLPGDLSRLAWENNSLKLFGINTVYHFLNVLLVALILSNM